MTEKRQKVGHGHPVEDGGHSPMPSEDMGLHRHTNPFIQRNKPKLFHLSRPSQEETDQHHFRHDH